MSCFTEETFDCEENLERQRSEILALASIYDDQFTVLPRSGKGFRVEFEADVPGSYRVRQLDEEMSRVVRHLPPLKVRFTLPHAYPSHSCPEVCFHTPWLMHLQVLDLKNKLKVLWECNKFSEILFIWAEFLRNEAIDFLKIPPVIVLPGKQYDNVIIYDEARRHAVLEHSTVMCEICFEVKPGLQFTMFKPCEHMFCVECIQTDYEMKIREGNLAALVCPSQSCESTADLDQVKSLVSSKTFERYDRLLLQMSLGTMSDVYFCPAKNCAYPVIVDKGDGFGMCPNCQHVFCIYCQKTWHGIELCKDKSDTIKQLANEYVAANSAEKEALQKRHGKKVFQAVFDVLSVKWVKENGRPCPNCGSYIEKTGGCHKMHCFKCNAYFCWLCMAVICAENPYEHFSDESSPCYNKLFLGVDVDQYAPYVVDDDGNDEEGHGQMVNYEGQNAAEGFAYERRGEELFDLRGVAEYLWEPYILEVNELEQVEGGGYDQEWEEFRVYAVDMKQQHFDLKLDAHLLEGLDGPDREGNDNEGVEGEVCYPKQQL